MAKTRTVAGAGTIAIAVLVLIFGSQPVVEWVNRHTKATSVPGWFLRVLAWPRWAFGPDDNSNAAMRRLLSEDIRALLLIALVAVLLAAAAKSVTGGFGAFLLGWGVVMLAAALAAFLTGFILADPSFLGALELAAQGSRYGLFAGWIVGAVTVTGKAA
jgi:hypothetical protein